jgi:hypothetical protein
MQIFGHFSREFKLFWQNKVLRLLFIDTVALYFVRLRLWQRKSNRSIVVDDRIAGNELEGNADVR